MFSTLLDVERSAPIRDASRAQVAVRLLGEFRQLKAAIIIKTVSDCDRQWPGEPGHVIESIAREKLRSVA
jgi:hypothetical protein